MLSANDHTRKDERKNEIPTRIISEYLFNCFIFGGKRNKDVWVTSFSVCSFFFARLLCIFFSLSLCVCWLCSQPTHSMTLIIDVINELRSLSLCFINFADFYFLCLSHFILTFFISINSTVRRITNVRFLRNNCEAIQ